MKVEKILLTTDFSKPSKKLLESAKQLKDSGLKEVILTHVVDISTAQASALQFQTNSKDVLEKEQEILEEAGLEVSVFVPVGFPANEIVQLANKEQVDMILIASHGKGYIKQIFLGSTTFDVIRIAETPVLIEKYEDLDDENYQLASQNKFNKVLLPLDLSQRSDNLVNWIKASNDIIDELVLLTVVEKSKDQSELKLKKDGAEAELKSYKEKLTAKGFEVETVIEVGTASENIITVAEEKEVDSIIMATRGMGTIKGLLLGSTANAVARKANLPVILNPSL